MCTLIRIHLFDVFTVEEDLTIGDLVVGVTSDRVGERGLARAVRTHDGVDLAMVDGEVDALEDLKWAVLSFHGHVEVLDFQSRHVIFSFS